MEIYNSKIFGKQLQKKVIKKENIDEIGDWAYEVLIFNQEAINENFEQVLNCLSFMSVSEEFEYSYEELEEIADKLIKGEDVKL